MAKATEDTVKGGGDSFQSKSTPKSAKIHLFICFILKRELIKCTKNNHFRLCFHVLYTMLCLGQWQTNEFAPNCCSERAVQPLSQEKVSAVQCRGSTKQNNPISVEMGFSCQQDRGVTPAVKRLNLCFRLRCLVKQLERGEASLTDLKKNLEYAASVLESVYVEETR